MLTDLAIARAKRPETPTKMGDAHGLYLFLRPSGARLWRMDYRWAGKRKTISFGVYGPKAVTLADARELAREAREHLKAGRDPMAERRAKRRHHVALASLSIERVADEWFENQTDYAEKTRKRVRSLLNQMPRALATAPISTLEPPAVLEALRQIERRGTLHVARRLKIVLGQICRYAIGCGYAARDPTADLRGLLRTPPDRHHAALTTPTDVGALLRAIDGLPLTSVGYALRIEPHVFVRPVELRLMRWSECDLDAACWIIPAERTKQRADLIVPFSRQVVALLREMPRRDHADLVFPSPRTRSRPLSDAALTAGLRQLGYTRDQMVAHGFRAMARTLLDEQLRFDPAIIEVQLGHKVPSLLGDTYNRARYLEQRVEMMQRWSDYLDELRDAKPTA
ncbi:MAG TPA: integrase arm-type DNA-binding domain-containing protein [Vicinamibacterales bacterium]|jgi:integrase|nr:integrase arm-type DNA-binding domain-containing protein [Vicinamibacterales bacterium]